MTLKIKYFFAGYILFSLVVFFFPAIAYVAQTKLGIFPSIASFVLIGLGSAIIFAFERMLPLKPEWNQDHEGDTVSDIKYAVGNTIIFVAITQSVILFIPHDFLHRGALFLECMRFFGIQDIPSGVLLALKIAHFGVFYLATENVYHRFHNRLHHAKPGSFWWKVHSVHHNSQRLYSLNSIRMHYIEAVIFALIPVATLMVIGGSPITLTVYVIHSSLSGMMQHANIKVTAKCTWVGKIFITPHMHRQHHLEDGYLYNGKVLVL